MFSEEELKNIQKVLKSKNVTKKKTPQNESNNIRMAVTGSGNARAMASGISKATLPTMAGMVVALSGLFFTNSLERKDEWSVEQLEDELELAD